MVNTSFYLLTLPIIPLMMEAKKVFECWAPAQKSHGLLPERILWSSVAMKASGREILHIFLVSPIGFDVNRLDFYTVWVVCYRYKAQNSRVLCIKLFADFIFLKFEHASKQFDFGRSNLCSSLRSK
jgi:hypothetical protein